MLHHLKLDALQMMIARTTLLAKISNASIHALKVSLVHPLQAAKSVAMRQFVLALMDTMVLQQHNADPVSIYLKGTA